MRRYVIFFTAIGFKPEGRGGLTFTKIGKIRIEEEIMPKTIKNIENIKEKMKIKTKNIKEYYKTFRIIKNI